MSKKVNVIAEFNHGRWIARCPDCNGAEEVKRGQKFWCLSDQWNFEKGWQENPPVEYMVAFPSKDNEKSAMRLIRLRKVGNMNWLPQSESIQFLRDENTKEGIR